MMPDKRVIKANFPLVWPFIRAVASAVRHQSSKKRIRRLLKERNALFVEVGAGDKKGENGWLTIDLTENCDIFWDLRRGLPFPDESLSKIYSSHFLEHLSYKQGQEFLDECKRVLCILISRFWPLFMSPFSGLARVSISVTLVLNLILYENGTLNHAGRASLGAAA